MGWNGELLIHMVRKDGLMTVLSLWWESLLYTCKDGLYFETGPWWKKCVLYLLELSCCPQRLANLSCWAIVCVRKKLLSLYLWKGLLTCTHMCNVFTHYGCAYAWFFLQIIHATVVLLLQRTCTHFKFVSRWQTVWLPPLSSKHMAEGNTFTTLPGIPLNQCEKIQHSWYWWWLQCS